MNTETTCLRAKDIFLFLIGNSESIRRVVRSPWSLVAGVLLVWSAGITRHYDLHNLIEQHRWMWAPFLVVIVSSFLIYFCLYFAFLRRRKGEEKGPGFFRQYPSFLGAFLLTAPIAWIYAIPVEHFTNADALASAKWNMGFLAIVSFWRVGLIAKVIVVMTKSPWWKALIVVFFPASVEAMLASSFEVMDIVGMMGGIELAPSEQFRVNSLEVISNVSLWIILATFITIWIPLKTVPTDIDGFVFVRQPAPRNALIAAALCLVAWFGYCLPFQINAELREPRQSMDRYVLREKARADAMRKSELEDTDPPDTELRPQ